MNWRPKFQHALTELGLTASGLEQSVKKDASGALRDFIKRLGAAKDKTGIITDLFGKGSDSRAIAQLAADATQLDKAFALIGNSNAAGSMMREFEARAKTTANQLQLLQNNVTEIGINIGAAILPAINSLATDLRPVLTGFADFAKANPEIIKTGVAILGVVAVVGPLISMVGGAITAIGTIGTALSFLGTSFTSIGAFGAAALGVFRAFAFSAGGLAVILGAAVVGMFQFGAALSGVNVSAGETVSALGVLIGDSLAQLPVRLGMIIPVTQAILSSLWVSVVTTFWNMRSEITIWADGVISSLSATWTNLSTSTSAAFTGLANAISQGMGQAKAAVSGACSAILGILNGIAQGCFAAGANIVNSIASGIRSGIGAVTSAASQVAHAVASFLPHSPPEQGALKDIMQVGGRIVNFIADGIVPQPISSAMNSALSPVNPALMQVASAGGGGAIGGGGGVVLNYSTNVTVGSSADGKGFQAMLNDHRDQLMGLIEEHQRNKARVAYS